MTSPDALTIRPVRASDAVEWRRLWTLYLGFYETVLPEAVFQSTFARLLGTDPRDFNGLIAEADLLTSAMSKSARISSSVKISWSPCDQPSRAR